MPSLPLMHDYAHRMMHLGQEWQTVNITAVADSLSLLIVCLGM